MWGDVLNSIRWDEVNDCGTFQEGNKRKIKLYGKPVKNLEFNNEIEAEQRLYKYYRRTHKGRLLYENEDEEEKESDGDNRPKIYFSGKTSDREFEGFRGHIESLIERFSYPSLEEIEKENKFFVFFYKGISYVIRGNDVIIKDEIKINPQEYYPDDWEKGDTIPADTVNKIIAAKLGINWKIFRDILNNNSDFHGYKKEKSYKEKVFNTHKEETMEDDKINSLIEALKPGELLIITRTDDGWMFKGEGVKGIPNGKGKWINKDGDIFGGEFINGIANGEGYVKFGDGVEFKGVWKNGVMKADGGKDKGKVTFHIEDLNFDNIIEKLVVQRNEDGGLSVFKFE